MQLTLTTICHLLQDHYLRLLWNCSWPSRRRLTAVCELLASVLLTEDTSIWRLVSDSELTAGSSLTADAACASSGSDDDKASCTTSQTTTAESAAWPKMSASACTSRLSRATPTASAYSIRLTSSYHAAASDTLQTRFMAFIFQADWLTWYQIHHINITTCYLQLLFNWPSFPELLQASLDWSTNRARRLTGAWILESFSKLYLIIKINLILFQLSNVTRYSSEWPLNRHQRPCQRCKWPTK